MQTGGRDGGARRLARSSLTSGLPGAPVLFGQGLGVTLRTPPQFLKRGLWVSPAPPVPASEKLQVALVLSLGIFLDDLRVIRV